MNSITIKSTNRISCQLHQIFFLVLLCLLEAPEGYATIRNSAHPRVDARAETNLDSCRNPRNEVGTCINILQCSSMVELLKSSRENPTAVDFLRKAGCGYEGRHPKVCCTDALSISTSQPNFSPFPDFTSTPTWNRRPETTTTSWNRRPETTSSSWDRRPETTSSSWDRRPETTSSSWNRRPETTSSSWNRRPETTSSSWDRRPETTTSSWNRRPDTTSSSWNRRPETTTTGSNRADSWSSTSFPNKKPERLTDLSGLSGQERCGTSKTGQANRIVGGQPAELGAWPWITALGYRKWTSQSLKPNWLCGGALISTRHVITAAHCISARSDLNLHMQNIYLKAPNCAVENRRIIRGTRDLPVIRYIVRLGELDLDSNVKDGASPVDILIAEKIAHPGFNTSTFVNDIGVLRLQQDVVFNDLIQPICLPFAPEIKSNKWVNYSPFVAGWGTIASNGPPSTALRQVQVPVVDNDECKHDYRNIKTAIIDDRVLCAGLAQGGKDSCQGDSGGPLMIPQELTFYLIGVVSYGKKCAEPGFPGVYTRVSNYLEWIAQTTK